jgi:hypothetical protein
MQCRLEDPGKPRRVPFKGGPRHLAMVVGADNGVSKLADHAIDLGSRQLLTLREFPEACQALAGGRTLPQQKRSILFD